MTHDVADDPNSFAHDAQETADLVFLRDEGLELLALFQRIRDPEQRKAVRDHICAIVEEQPAL